MHQRSSLTAMALAAALSMAPSAARAADESKYPDLNGRWVGVGGPN